MFVDPTFALSDNKFDNANHLTAFPAIELLFAGTPASGTFTSFLTVEKESVLPRNDIVETFTVSGVAGNWVLLGNNATFTPTEAIRGNTRYVVTVSRFMASDTGVLLGEDIELSFTGVYSPYYVNLRALKARLRGTAEMFTDDLLRYFIFRASLESNARYTIYTEGLAGAGAGDALPETSVRDSIVLRGHAVLRWTEAYALLQSLRSILNDEIYMIGRSRQLSDWRETLDDDFLKGIQAAIIEAEKELEEYEELLAPDDDIVAVSRHAHYDLANWRHDYILRGIEGNRRNL